MKILSISDVITNSSSEVFCIINHNDKKILQDIYDELCHILDEDEYNDYRPSIYYNKEEEDRLEVWMPYHLSDCEAFYKAGLEAILREKFEDYTINYE